jgi:hypothetical protein
VVVLTSSHPGNGNGLSKENLKVHQDGALLLWRCKQLFQHNSAELRHRSFAPLS